MEEAKTSEFDQDIKLTPFNMKDEMDEGDFDKDGFYHWKKDKDEIKDAWLDNIDWANINSFKKSDRLTKEDPNEEEEEESEEEVDNEETETADDQTEKFKKIREFMKPGETILKTIKRLGTSSKSTGGSGTAGSTLSASQRWLKKKNVTESNESQSNPEKAKADKESLEKLTEICNYFISQGFYEIYEETYDSIGTKIENESKEKSQNTKSFDIFADEVNEKDLVADKPGTSGTNKNILEGDYYFYI